VPQNQVLIWPFELTTLARLLGFREEFYEPGKHRGDYEIFQHDTVSCINVHCDLIAPQLVGDALAPIIRSIPLAREKRDENISKCFAFPEYYKINRNTFDSVSVKITDGDTGQPLILQAGGKSLVTLSLI
jgi:hypothetical protein